MDPKKNPASAGLGTAEMCCNLCLENDQILKNITIATVESIANVRGS